VFIALAYHFGRKPMLGMMDAEIAKIRDELEHARKLRADAESMLEDYKARQRGALAEAETIVSNATLAAEQMKKQAEEDLKSSLQRHEQQAMDRIRVAEAEALADVRMSAINMAMDIARKTLASQLDDAAASKLVDQAIADLPKQSSDKAAA
jgi:F-type H+-transporting ATPase subunit b